MTTFTRASPQERSSAFRRLASFGPDGASSVAILSYLLQSSGLFVRRVERSVWVHGASPAEFHAARPLIEQVMRPRPHTRLVTTSDAPATIEYLARIFPDEQRLPVPWEHRYAIGRFLASIRPGVVLVLDSGRTFGPAVTRQTLQAGVPAALLVSEPANRIAPHIIDSALTYPGHVHFCLSTPDDVGHLIARGIPRASLHLVGDLAADSAHATTHANCSTVRRLMALPMGVRVIMAVDVPHEEESLILEAFQEVRTVNQDVRLVLAPRHRRCSLHLAAKVKREGWICRRRTNALTVESGDPWDVLLAEVPGEIPSLLPASSATLVGGSWSERRDAILDAIARATGCCAVLGSETSRHQLGLRLQQALADERRPRATERSSARLKCLAALAKRLPTSPALPPVAQAWRIPTLRDKCGASRLWHSVAPLLRGARYDDVTALRARLKHPRTILCLGNGPSSEQPELQSIDHDCLLRVNWRWKDRGLLTSPDIVMVGDPASIQKLSNCIFGLWTIEMEYGMLLRNLATRGLRRMECVTLERISPLVRERQWPARPSSGALMIVLAAAMQPERLIIGGIDLFQHPDGRYPGDVSSSNQYSRVHERDTDLALMGLALQDYRGELVILSDILRESLSLRACSA